MEATVVAAMKGLGGDTMQSNEEAMTVILVTGLDGDAAMWKQWEWTL